MKMELKAAFSGLLNTFRPPVKQVAALCLRQTDAGPEVLLITSSEQNWILPKGWPMDGKTHAEAAAIEAWEEAGVHAADVSETPVAQLNTTKTVGGDQIIPCTLEVFEVEVDSLAESYPEDHKRDRRWIPLKQAANMVDATEISDMLRSYAA